MRILLAHTSLSANTRDVARAIHARCDELGHAVTWIDAGIQTLAKACPDGAEQNRGQSRLSADDHRDLMLC